MEAYGLPTGRFVIFPHVAASTGSISETSQFLKSKFMNAIIVWLIIIMLACFVPYGLGKLNLFDLNIRDDIAFLIWLKGSLILGILLAGIILSYTILILFLHKKK